MRELTDDAVYRLLEAQYPDVLLDYVLLSAEGAPEGKAGHKAAVLAALHVLNTRERVGNLLVHPPVTAEPEKMHCVGESPETLFSSAASGRSGGQNRISPPPWEMSYWEAYFYEPYPHSYGKAGFEAINAVLFPVQNRSQLKVYRWSGDFSNYFEQGKELFGTMLLSVYDPALSRYVIIGSSLTD